jgi:positive phototaxis protein PixI
MNVSDILQLSAPEKKKLGTPHLKVWLDQEMPAAIAMNDAHAAMAIEPSRISPMPNMPSHVVGMLAHRSRVIWTIDLAKMLNLTPVNLRQPKLNVILLEVDRQMLACLVPRVDSVMRFMPEEVISPLGNFSAELVPYLQGWLPYSRDILLVLSARALVTAPLIGQKI